MDQTTVQRYLSYEPGTGIFRWRVAGYRITHIGMAAGCAKSRGYVHIQIEGRKYTAHRLAWLYSYGAWPPADIDHVNGNTSDNRLSNLRLATKTENQGNSHRIKTTKGVRLHSCGKWEARIQCDGKPEYLGLFPSEAAAKAAYMTRAKALFGEFAHS